MGEQDNSAQPVGLEYIEEDRSGKIIQFHCKLCDCKFNDPNAKEMHLKGRRHRLQFKKKVDPSLDVDLKPSIRARRVHEERSRLQRADFFRRRDLEERMLEMQAMEAANFWGRTGGAFPGRTALRPSHAPPPPMAKRMETVDDKHVQAKHASIYPSEAELKAVQQIVSSCEKALKLVSDLLNDEDLAAAAASTNGLTTTTSTPTTASTSPSSSGPPNSVGAHPRQLKGVVRVGALAKGLLLQHDLNVDLVLLAGVRPSLTFLQRVHQHFVQQIKAVAAEENYEVRLDAESACLVVLASRPPLTACTITCTSPLLREDPCDGKEPKENGEEKGTAVVPSSDEPPDPLDRAKCLAALSWQRHAKWFQATCSGRQVIVIIIRIMRDLCARVPTWSPLLHWPLELLVEKVVSSGPPNLSVGEALRRLFECVASGAILAAGRGLLDPCEREATDAAAGLSSQEREDITASAQHALRLIAFRQIHKVLDMEPLAPGEKRSGPPDENSAGEEGGPPAEKRERVG